MRKRLALCTLLGAALLGPALLLLASPATAGEIAPARAAELDNMLIQDCGSCHGLRMTGGLGTPLTPDAIADWTDQGLVATILFGRPGTAMPPWEPLLSEDEAQWMVDRLREGVTQ